MQEKEIFEILVDRHNEKWPWAFEHILVILHKTLQKKKKHFWEKTVYFRPTFSFEIAKIWNKIRFFMVCSREYAVFLQNQIYAQYTNVEIVSSWDYLQMIPPEKMLVGQVKLHIHSLFPIKSFADLQKAGNWETIDPFSSLTWALSKTTSHSINLFQINFSPLPDEYWKKNVERTLKIIKGKYPKVLKSILLKHHFSWLKVLVLPFYVIWKLFSFLVPKEELVAPWDSSVIPDEIKEKLEGNGYGVSLNLVSASEDSIQNTINIREIFSTLGIYAAFWQNSFDLIEICNEELIVEQIKNRAPKDDFILTTRELSGLVHLPTETVSTPWINWVLAHHYEPPSNLPIFQYGDGDITPLGKTNFRWEQTPFGIGSNDRRRHIYIIGKTGMGKSTLLENMIIDDIQKGRGVAVIDPHGDLAEAVIGNIPKSRTNQTIIFDPSDANFPIAFNMLDNVKPEHKSLVASGLVGIFKKIFGDSWGPRLEHTLRNTIIALLDYPNTTLISVPLMLTSEVYRNKVVERITDPVVKKFWTHEFAKWSPTQKVEAAWPILNKVGQFLSSSLLRNVLGQPKNSFSMRWAMDNQKIVIVNLSKWKIGEDASSLLGAMLVTKFQIDAMSRADIKESERRDFYLYVDEFQNFATDSFATILSEARKYKLNLVMANQYIDQMTESVKGAVFWNVWSLVSFQVWYHDSMIMKEVFWGDIQSEDLTNLKKYTIYMKELIDWMPSKVFSADTFPPSKIDPEVFETRYNKILQVSREKFGSTKELVEQKIYKSIKDVDVQEEKLEQFKAKKKEEKEKEKRG